MLTAQIRVTDIGYAETLNRIFPMLYYKIITAESRHLLLRLLQKLGQNALPVCQGLLERLGQEDKDALLVLSLNAYADSICEGINRRLAADPLGRHLTLSSVAAQKQGAQVLLLAEGIQVDYQGLLGEEAVQRKMTDQLGSLSGFAKLAAKAAVSAAPEWLETKGLSLLQQEENRRRLLRLAQPILESQGFVMTLSDLSMTNQTNAAPAAVNSGFRLDPALEEHLLTAIADYLTSALR